MLGVNHKLQMRDLLLEEGNLLLKILATGNAKEKREKDLLKRYTAIFTAVLPGSPHT